MKKNIKIVCCINNVLIVNNFKINYYDQYHKLLATKNTTNNTLDDNLDDFTKFIEIETNNPYLQPNKQILDVSDIKNNTLNFYFMDKRFISFPITITFTDQNYEGLIIEKGTAYL